MIDNMDNLDDLTLPGKINSGVTMIHFFAENCNPCRIFSPIFTELKNDNLNDAKIYSANIKNVPITTQKYNIVNVPAVLVFKNGKMVGKKIGIQHKSSLYEMLKTGLS